MHWPQRFLIAFLIGVLMAASQQKSHAAEEYELVWADEFNKDGPLDSKDWAFEQGFLRNQELQWYQPDNAVCKDGLLIIEARREIKPNPQFVDPTTRPSG